MWAAKVIKILIASILATGAKVSSESMPSS